MDSSLNRMRFTNRTPSLMREAALQLAVRPEAIEGTNGLLRTGPDES